MPEGLGLSIQDGFTNMMREQRLGGRSGSDGHDCGKNQEEVHFSGHGTDSFQSGGLTGLATGNPISAEIFPNEQENFVLLQKPNKSVATCG
jgi:hypothetical protein